MQSADDRYCPAFPNPNRPKYWPGEEGHFRSSFELGDVVRMEYGALGRITAFDNTWSHLTGGRIVHVEPLLAYLAPEPPNARPYGHRGCWERHLTAAQPGDISAHAALRDGYQWGQSGCWRPVSASWERLPVPTGSDADATAADPARPDAPASASGDQHAEGGSNRRRGH